MILIHFDRTLGEQESSDAAGTARSAKWYAEWLRGRSESVHILLPASRKGEYEQAEWNLPPSMLLWYATDGTVSVPPPRRRERVWVVNGDRLPMVNWKDAVAEARRQESDVLVFGLTAHRAALRYPESVQVNEAGEVVRFQRHYFDSPVYTEPWSGQAAFLVSSAERAPSVVSHVLLRGWGLDSIGALTQRFTVRWSRSSCVLPLSHSAGLITGPVAPEDFASSVSTADAAANHTNGNVDAWDDDHGQVATAGGIPTNGHDAWQVTGDRFSSLTNDTAEDEGPFDEGAHDPFYLLIKRSMDVMAAAIGLTLLLPLLVIVGLLVKLTSRGPILFAHKRQGLGGREFSCLKFRSMTVNADAQQAKLRAQNEVDGPQFKITEDPRLTKIGGWLRRYNIDELPQLINVLLGQMSLVGPRPSPDAENRLCPAWRRTRLSVKPGITGLWQVLRRRDQPEADFQQWIYYDVEYARHQSLWLDVQLLLYTPVAMFAPSRLGSLAARLERHGICVHFHHLGTPAEMPTP